MIRIRSMWAVLALAPALAAAQGSSGSGVAQPKETANPAARPSAKAAPSKADAAAKPTSPGAPGAAASSKAAAPKGGAAATTPPAARDLAKALTTEEAWNGILDGYASSLSGQISGALAATGKEAPADLREKVRGELHDAVRYDQAVDMQARALAGRFSEAELRELERFYESPAGRKLLTELPSIAAQVNDELRGRLSERVPKIVEKYAPSLAAAGKGGAADGGAKGSAGSGAKGAEPEGTPKPTPKAQGRSPTPEPPPRR